MVDPTQMCPSSTTPLGQFQGICNIERLKGGPWSPELLRGPKLEGGPNLKGGTSDPSSCHVLKLVTKKLVAPNMQVGSILISTQ